MFLFGIILFWLAGMLFYQLITKRFAPQGLSDAIHLLPITFGLGCGIVYFLFLLTNWVLPYDHLWGFWGAVLLAIIVVWVYLGHKSVIKIKPEMKTNKWDRLECLLLILILSIILINTIIILRLPILEWDTRIIWGIKSKILISEKTIISDAFLNPYRLHIHPRYPLLFPTMVATLSLFGGAFKECYLQILIIIFGILSVYILYQMVLQNSNRKEALILVILLTLTGGWLTGLFSSSVEILLMFYLLLTLQSMQEWLKNASLTSLFLTAFFLFCSASVKQEGLLIAFCIIIALLIIKFLKIQKDKELEIRFLDIIGISVIFMGFMLVWLSYLRLIPPVSDENYIMQLMHGYLYEHLQRIPVAIKGFFLEIVNLKRWHLVWLSLPLSCVWGWKNERLRGRFDFLLCSFLLLYLAGIFCIYIISPWRDIGLHIKVSLHRVLLPMLPVSLLILSKAIYQNRETSW